MFHVVSGKGDKNDCFQSEHNTKICNCNEIKVNSVNALILSQLFNCVEFAKHTALGSVMIQFMSPHSELFSFLARYL